MVSSVFVNAESGGGESARNVRNNACLSGQLVAGLIASLSLDRFSLARGNWRWRAGHGRELLSVLVSLARAALEPNGTSAATRGGTRSQRSNPAKSSQSASRATDLSGSRLAGVGQVDYSRLFYTP